MRRFAFPIGSPACVLIRFFFVLRIACGGVFARISRFVVYRKSKPSERFEDSVLIKGSFSFTSSR